MTEEVKLDPIYVDLSLSPNDMVKKLDQLMEYFDKQNQSVYIGWANDKGAQEMLWEHREKEGHTPDLSGFAFDALDDAFLNGSAKASDSDDFDDFGDFSDFGDFGEFEE